MLLTVTNAITSLSDVTLRQREVVTSLLAYREKVTIKHASSLVATPEVDCTALSGDNTFLTGFLPIVCAELDQQHIRYELHDLRSPGKIAPYDISVLPFTLRPYQADALQAFFTAKRGIVQLPMGGGKTELGIAACLLLPIRWLYLVPGVELLDEVKARFARHNKSLVGRIGRGERWVQRVTVATLESAIKDFGAGLLKSVQGIVLDECQKAASKARINTLGRACNAEYRLGMSYTPFARTDGRELFTVGVTGQRIFCADDSVLNASGFLTPGTVTAVEYDSEPVDPEKHKTFLSVYKEGVVRNDARNDLVVELFEAHAKPAIVFAKLHEHIHDLVGRFCERGWRVVCVHQDVPEKERKQIIADTQAGLVDVVVASAVWERGINVPVLRTGINAAGGASDEPVRQRRGRLTRLAPGKTAWRYFEIIDRNHEWLERHSEERMRVHRHDQIVCDVDDRRSAADDVVWSEHEGPRIGQATAPLNAAGDPGGCDPTCEGGLGDQPRSEADRVEPANVHRPAGVDQPAAVRPDRKAHRATRTTDASGVAPDREGRSKRRTSRGQVTGA